MSKIAGMHIGTVTRRKVRQTGTFSEAETGFEFGIDLLQSGERGDMRDRVEMRDRIDHQYDQRAVEDIEWVPGRH